MLINGKEARMKEACFFVIYFYLSFVLGKEQLGMVMNLCKRKISCKR